VQFHEKTGLWAVTAMRWSFDKITGYPHNMNEEKWLQRIVFLETVAGQHSSLPPPHSSRIFPAFMEWNSKFKFGVLTCF